jgi:hypothetical protein
LRIICPTIQLLITVGAKTDAGRVSEVDAIRASNKHVPAALAGRRFLHPPSHKGAQVHGGKIDLHVQPLQKVRGHVAICLMDGKVLRRH